MSLFVRDEESDEEIVIQLPNQHTQSEEQRQEEEPEEYPLLPNRDDEDLIDQLEPLNVTLSLPLHFQQLILEDLIADDSLLVLGKGLGLERIVANLLHTLSAPMSIKDVKKQSLVILLNATDDDNDTLRDELTELSWLDDSHQSDFQIIRSDTFTSDKRRELYQKGGVMSVTSRIFIVDILSGVVQSGKITGMVVMHAEQLNDLSNESFIVQMYRQQNKWGFIKAVSDSAMSFTTGFAPLQKKLRDLRIKKVVLWPRFHIEVSSSLLIQDSKPVIEIKVGMSESMRQIQTGLYACLKKCIDELKRKNPTLAIEYWSIENALDPGFLGTIHMILDPHWHRISYDTKQLVKDIKLLKDLMKCLISYDCVDFYEMIQLVLEANRPSIDKKNSESPWLLAEESQAVVTYSKKRVFDEDQYMLEEVPKWEQLAVLLDDIVLERQHDSKKTGPVLIMCSDDKVKRQLTRFISTMRENGDRCFSARKLMVTKLQDYMDSKELKSTVTTTIKESIDDSDELSISRAFAKAPVVTKRRRTRGGAAVAAVSRLHRASIDGDDDIEGKLSKDDMEMELMELELHDEVDNDLEQEEEYQSQMDIDNVTLQQDNDPSQFYQYISREMQVIVARYNGKNDDKILHELQPSFIVMYEPSLAFIRRVELYQSIHRESQAGTYFMYYSDSIEEQMHLTAIRKEKESFTKLIREKAALAIHFEGDDERFKTTRPKILNTRIAGGMTHKSEEKVLVDAREFRAPLPGLLHRVGMRVIPCVLTVGDYILTPRVCVERKSIPDLIGSFKSGRLYEQCERMCQYYSHPALLIEFDNNQSFSLEPFSETRMRPNSIKAPHPSSTGRMQEEIQKDIAALVINFPKMRILWSSSPYQTAELMMELKEGREEPDIVKAVNAGLNEDKQKDNVELSNNIVAILQNIPGITNIDYFFIMKKVKNVKRLMKMKRYELVKIVGEDLGGKIHEYLAANYNEQ